MNIQLKGDGLEITDSIRDYVNKRIAPLARLADKEGSPAQAEVEVGFDTRHHKSGEVFRAEANISAQGHVFRAESTEEDLFAAIDDIKEDLERQLVATKDREGTLFRRGARSVKKMLKGLSKRNPFTSKY